MKKKKGILYTKTKGVLLAKGKYVMTLDDDDRYIQRDAFSTLYAESEKYKVDMIKFKFVQGVIFSIRKIFEHKIKEEYPIIYQPELSNYFYYKKENGKIGRNGGAIWTFIFRTDVFVKAIKQIDDKYLNVKTNYHDDFLILFLITRTAKSLKRINRIFYVVMRSHYNHEPKSEYRNKEKMKNRENLACFAYLNYIEIMYYKTHDTIEDKKIAFYNIERWLLNNHCKNNMENREKAINICKIFLESKYIEEKDKNKIKNFLNSINKKYI